MKKLSLLTILIVMFLSQARSQNTLAEKLGYDAGAKLLIVHADDAGMCHAENEATEKAFLKGGISSTSLMVPCPWAYEFALWNRENPGYDVGIHLTLTAEWESYKWGGVLPSAKIPSLVDENGFFPASDAVAAKNANPAEVEAELRAQIERAISWGIHPSHLDAHMGTLFRTKELFSIYLKMGREYRLPVLIPRNMIRMYPHLLPLLEDSEAIWYVDNLYMMSGGIDPGKWAETYKNILKAMQPGLNELIVHLGIATPELYKITEDHPDFGADWRQRDYDFVTSEQFKELLKKYDIHLVTWGQIRKVAFSEVQKP